MITLLSVTMGRHNLNTTLVIAGFCLCFSYFISASEDCICPGPIQYYKDVGCTPVFKNPGDCCPERYNCDHLKNLPTDKCFVNDHEYSYGEMLREEDSNPCDIGCFCADTPRGPEFNCAIVDCFFAGKPGCYYKRTALSCCPGEEVCPEKEEDIPTCVVDGKTYKDGEYFSVAEDPDLNCVCGEGYTGENVEPFCAKPKHSYCSPLFRHAGDVRENCAPTYYSSQSPRTSCSVASRCQNSNDTVIPGESEHSGEPRSTSDDPKMKCTFGNLTLNIGDELNQSTDYSSVCVKCVCEVPPVVTCQRLPDNECDVTKHPNFNAN